MEAIAFLSFFKQLIIISVFIVDNIIFIQGRNSIIFLDTGETEADNKTKSSLAPLKILRSSAMLMATRL